MSKIKVTEEVSCKVQILRGAIIACSINPQHSNGHFAGAM